jgi:hypothetical protein
LHNQVTWGNKYRELAATGELAELMKSRVHKGKDNGMYGKHPPKGAGRCKHLVYTSTTSGITFYIQGSFELRFSIFLDRLGCCWEKTKDRFCYTYNGVDRTYNPDFKVIRSRGRVFYYETKGYINEEALVKFSVMKNLNLNFIVVDRKRLERYEQFIRA